MRLSMVAGTIALMAMPVLANAADWTGGYAGVQLGYGWLDSDTTSGEGEIGGLHGGYLFDTGTYVFGGELDYDSTQIDFGGGDEVESIIRLKGKAGYDLGQTLVYGTLGVAIAEATIGGTSYDDTGWFIGVGVDQLVTDNISIGAEVLYHDFNEFDTSGSDLSGTTLALRASYHF